MQNGETTTAWLFLEKAFIPPHIVESQTIGELALMRLVITLLLSKKSRPTEFLATPTVFFPRFGCVNRTHEKVFTVTHCGE
jgi:hypothetical protein